MALIFQINIFQLHFLRFGDGAITEYRSFRAIFECDDISFLEPVVTRAIGERLSIKHLRHDITRKPHFFIGAAIPHRYAVPEPNLAADTPVAQVIDPVKIGLIEMFGEYLDITMRKGLAHELFERLPATRSDRFVHVHEPLQFYLRLDDTAGALRGRDVVCILFLFDEQTFLFEFFDDLRARLGYLHAGELSGDREELANLTDDLFLIKTMTFRDLEVRLRVPGGDGHHASAEFHVDSFVFDDGRGDGTIDPLHFERIAVFPFRIALIIRVHHDIFIAELRLGTRRADDEGTVLKVVEFCFFLDVDDFVVRNSCLPLGIPVHDAATAVDETVVVHHLKHRIDCPVAFLVECISFPAPVAGSAHGADLRDDGVMTLRGEGFHAFQKLLATELRAGRTLLGEVFLDFGLCRDSGMIGTR